MTAQLSATGGGVSVEDASRAAPTRTDRESLEQPQGARKGQSRHELAEGDSESLPGVHR